MSAKQQKRLILVLSLVLGVSVAIGLIMFALSQNINLFYTPTQLVEKAVQKNQAIRIGGMVVKNSVQRKENMEVEFVITDYKKEIKIHYRGILPDLFREGQGIVALGKVTKEGSFIASQVLAKHDENYMPPEITKALNSSAAIPLKQNIL